MGREHLLYEGCLAAAGNLYELLERGGHAVFVVALLYGEFKSVVVGCELLLLAELGAEVGLRDVTELALCDLSHSTGSIHDVTCRCGKIGLAHRIAGILVHDVAEFVAYVIAQVVGAICGTAVLAAIFGLGHVTDMTGVFGANGLAGVNGNVLAGLLVEIVLTFIFVIAILGVTSRKAGHGSFGGLVIGLTLVVVHILGIGLTGTSVNPARSFGPALFAAFKGNTAPLGALWVFIVGPMIGAALAAFAYKALETK